MSPRLRRLKQRRYGFGWVAFTDWYVAAKRTGKDASRIMVLAGPMFSVGAVLRGIQDCRGMLDLQAGDQQNARLPVSNGG